MGQLHTLKTQGNRSLILYNGVQGGKQCYFFILANKIKAEILKTPKKGRVIIPDEFGKVVESGFGVPTQALIDEVTRKHKPS